MLKTLVTSKTRRKLLVKFFLNPSNKSYLRDLETEFGESTNSIRLELNRFEESGMLMSEVEGNKKIFRANTGHQLFNEIQKLLMKYTGIDQLTENVLNRLYGLRQAWLTGDIALGRDTGNIDLLLVGDHINPAVLQGDTNHMEEVIGRKIHCTIIKQEKSEMQITKYPERLMIFWKMTDEPVCQMQGAASNESLKRRRKRINVRVLYSNQSNQLLLKR